MVPQPSRRKPRQGRVSDRISGVRGKLRPTCTCVQLHERPQVGRVERLDDHVVHFCLLANCLVARIGGQGDDWRETQDASLDRQARAASSPERPGMCTSSNTKNRVCAIRASTSSARGHLHCVPTIFEHAPATKTFNWLSSTTSTGRRVGRWADGLCPPWSGTTTLRRLPARRVEDGPRTWTLHQGALHAEFALLKLNQPLVMAKPKPTPSLATRAPPSCSAQEQQNALQIGLGMPAPVSRTAEAMVSAHGSHRTSPRW